MADKPRETSIGPHRIIALEIRPRRFGFFVIEDMSAVDWGVRSYHSGAVSISDTGVKKLTDLIQRYVPDAIVIRRRRRNRFAGGIASFIEIIYKEADRHYVAVQIIDAARVKAYFVVRGAKSKDQRASILAKQFRDLAWRLPPARKLWESERHIMLVFDAAATAMTYLSGI